MCKVIITNKNKITIAPIYRIKYEKARNGRPRDKINREEKEISKIHHNKAYNGEGEKIRNKEDVRSKNDGKNDVNFCIIIFVITLYNQTKKKN